MNRFLAPTGDRRWRFLLSIVLLALLAVSLVSCSEKKMIPAVGSYSDVWLFTEEGYNSPMVRQFADILSNPVTYVFETENEFNVFVRDASQFNGNRDRKNMVILIRTDRPGKLKSTVFKMLGRDVMTRIKREGHLILFKEDLFARDQDIYFLLVNGSVEEEYVLTRLAPTLLERLRESTMERYRGYLLRSRENKGGAKYLWQKYGFSLRYPSDYHLLQERKELGGLELHRKDPSRVMGIFWQNHVDRAPQLSDSLSLLAFRQSMVDTLYHGDYMLEGESHFSRVEIAGKQAIRVKGVWQNDRDMTGGTFISYYFHDNKRRRLLELDLLLYAPGQEKHPLMRELEALATTFRF